MSILIKDMEMPKKKNGAVLIIYPNGKAAYEDGTEHEVIPLPPHGRLGDLDALCELCNNSKCHSITPNDIMRMPTIIPADKGVGE